MKGFPGFAAVCGLAALPMFSAPALAAHWVTATTVAYEGGQIVKMDFNNRVSGVPSISSQTTNTFAYDTFVETSSAYAYADLTTGRIGASARGERLATGQAHAELADTLHFTINGANDDTLTNISVILAFEGSFSRLPPHGIEPRFMGTSHYYFNMKQTERGGGFAVLDVYPYYGQLGTSNSFGFTNNTVISEGWANEPDLRYDAPSTYLVAEFTLRGATATVPIEMGMLLDVDEFMDIDFSHTGSIFFTLPDHVSFTSESGYFLTADVDDPASPTDPGAPVLVPEPGMLGLTGLGLLGIAAGGRARRRRAA